MKQVEHWLSYKGSCISLVESVPVRAPRGTVVFLHGRLGDSEVWSAVIDGLGDSYRCFRLDLPGFGRSFSVGGRGLTLAESGGLVLSLLERFVSESAVLVGHDVGGAVAEVCTALKPEGVAGVVLVNASCLAVELRRFRLGAWGVEPRITLGMLMKSTKGLSSASRAALVRPWRQQRTRGPLIGAIGAIQDSWPGPHERFAWREGLHRARRPSLFLWGGRDRLNPPERIHELVRSLDGDFFEEERCGHWPSLERPEWVVTKMKEFLFRVLGSHGLQVASRW